MPEPLETPRSTKRRIRLPKIDLESEGVARGAEKIARFSGTPQFLVYLSAFVIIWILWNTLAPHNLQFDKAELGFTALTLMLSLQASYSAPLILLAQNRQDDRDRVQAEQDRQTSERNLADTEYLTREIASLRHAIGDVATRDFIRSELRDAMEELREDLTHIAREQAAEALAEHADSSSFIDEGDSRPEHPTESTDVHPLAVDLPTEDTGGTDVHPLAVDVPSEDTGGTDVHPLAVDLPSEDPDGTDVHVPDGDVDNSDDAVREATETDDDGTTAAP